MWYDDPFVKFKKNKTNRRRKSGPRPILMVHAKVAEQRRDRIQRIGAVITLCVALVGSAWVASYGARVLGRQVFAENKAYTIRHIITTSDADRVPTALIREWAREGEDGVPVSEGDNLFAIDIMALRNQILKQYVVREATVQRVLPDTLVIDVSERIPIARLGPRSKSYTFDIDREGYLLGRSSQSSAQLPRIVGIDPHVARENGKISSGMAQYALRTLDLIDRMPGVARLVDIESIGVGHPDYLQMNLHTGEFVLLSPPDLRTKLMKLAKILEDAADRGEKFKDLDLTVRRNYSAIPVQPHEQSENSLRDE